MNQYFPVFLFPFLLLGAVTAWANKFNNEAIDPHMSKYYLREEIPMPKDVVFEPGSIALLPDQRIAVGTRRGEVWICEGAYGDDLSKVTWTPYFKGLHEPLGMYWQDGALYYTDREQFGRLVDRNGDDRPDWVETISAPWGLTGNYHEYAFGTTPDPQGNVFVTLCLTGSFTASAQWRGWVMKIAADGTATPYASGVRSPGGIGYDAEGNLYYTDNQGVWNGTSCLKHVVEKKFTGCPIGNVYYKDAPNMGPQPPDPVNQSRIVVERERIPELVPPAVQFPHGVVGQSPTAVLSDHTSGKFGPFAGQVFVGEQTHSEVQRVFLETVNGVRQGAVWEFLSGFEAGIVPMRLSDGGTLFIGGTTRGWGSRGNKPFTFERVRWKNIVPFETKTMEALPDGFRLTFTEPVDPASASDLASYQAKAWTYIYQSKYGSPMVDQVDANVTSARVAADHMSVELTVSPLTKGHIHHLQAGGIKSKSGEGLWHPDAYYTLNEIPNP